MVHTTYQIYSLCLAQDFVHYMSNRTKNKHINEVVYNANV